MSLNISTLASNDAGDALVDLIDGGSIAATGYIELRTGTKPASPQVAATGTLLATLNLSNPAFGNFSNGQATANAIAPDNNIAATGTATWFRIYNRDSVPIIDGDVTIQGGGGDIELTSVNLVRGGTVTVDSLTAIMPQ